MSAQWFIARQGKKYGPYPFEQLQEWARSGMLLPTEMVLGDSAKWQEAGSVVGLFAAPVAAATTSQEADGLAKLRVAVIRGAAIGLCVVVVMCGGVFALVHHRKKPTDQVVKVGQTTPNRDAKVTTMPKDSPKDVPGTSPQDGPKDSPKDGPKAQPKDGPKDSPKGVPKATPHDPVLAAFLATELPTYKANGFSSYRFGMKRDEVERVTTFDKEVYRETTLEKSEDGKIRLGSSLATNADANLRDPPYFREWNINEKKAERYLIADGRLVGMTKAFVGDNDQNVTSLIDTFGKTHKANSMFYTVRDESFSAGVRYISTIRTGMLYYAFPNVVLAIAMNEFSYTENGEEPRRQQTPPQWVQLCMFDRPFFEKTTNEMLEAHRKSLTALRKRASESKEAMDEWLIISKSYTNGIKEDAVTSSIFESLTTQMRMELAKEFFPPTLSGVRVPQIRRPEANAAKIGRYIASYSWRTKDGCDVVVGSTFISVARARR